MVSGGDSWAHIKTNKKGTLVVYWYEAWPFMWNKDGKVTGIEYEIMNGFQKYLKSKHHYEVAIKYKEGRTFEETYSTIRDKNLKGFLGSSSFSITSKRKAEVEFSQPYMPDITVVLSSKNIPVVDDAEEFDKIFPKLTAITAKGTTMEEDLLAIERERNIHFKFKYVSSVGTIVQILKSTDSTFAVVGLPQYLVELNANPGLSIIRQNLYPIKREGYAFIMPKGSDWSQPVNEYFASEEFKIVSKEIIDRYFKNNVYEYIENLFRQTDQVVLSNREKAIQHRELQLKTEEIKQEARLRNYLIAVVVIFLVLLIAIFTMYRGGKRLNRVLILQKVKNDRQRLELERKNRELTYLNDEKNNLIKILAHDLRAPINHVNGLANIILLENKNLTPDQVEMVSTIITAANRSSKMIGKILDIDAIESKRVNLTLEDVNAADLVRKTAASFEKMASDKNIRIVANELNDTLLVRADAIFLTEIMENLISNAIKFSFNNKSVEIGVIESKSQVFFWVKDEGPGLTNEDKEKLFQKFQRLSAKPTNGESSIGLGLSIVKKYAELMNGKVWCESEAGKGATFFLELPKSNS